MSAPIELDTSVGYTDWTERGNVSPFLSLSLSLSEKNILVVKSLVIDFFVVVLGLSLILIYLKRVLFPFGEKKKEKNWTWFLLNAARLASWYLLTYRLLWVLLLALLVLLAYWSLCMCHVEGCKLLFICLLLHSYIAKWRNSWPKFDRLWWRVQWWPAVNIAFRRVLLSFGRVVLFFFFFSKGEWWYQLLSGLFLLHESCL